MVRSIVSQKESPGFKPVWSLHLRIFFYQGTLVSPATNKNARSVPSVFAYFILHKELCLTLEVNRILSYFSNAKAEKKNSAFATLTVALNCLC